MYIGGAISGLRPETEVSDRPSAPIPAPREPLEDVYTALAHSPESVGTARCIARRAMRTWCIAHEMVDTVVLAVSELVTNAIEHARPPLVLHLHHEQSSGSVWVGVTDGGPAHQDGFWTVSCADDEHGRGISIVDAIADAHGSCTGQDGSSVHWARLAVG